MLHSEWQEKWKDLPVLNEEALLQQVVAMPVMQLVDWYNDQITFHTWCAFVETNEAHAVRSRVRCQVAVFLKEHRYWHWKKKCRRLPWQACA